MRLLANPTASTHPLFLFHSHSQPTPFHKSTKKYIPQTIKKEEEANPSASTHNNHRNPPQSPTHQLQPTTTQYQFRPNQPGNPDQLPLMPSPIGDIPPGFEHQVQERAREVDLSNLGARDRRRPPGALFHLRRREAVRPGEREENHLGIRGEGEEGGRI